jgi:hypothetical protein
VKLQKAVLEKHFPGFTITSGVDVAKGFTLKMLSNFPQSNITLDQLKAK